MDQQAIALTGEQVALIEKANPAFRERHVESSRPGELLAQELLTVLEVDVNVMRLEGFIYTVYGELKEAQIGHIGDPAFFRLQDVELKVTQAATYTGDGAVKLGVVKLGSFVYREHTHHL